MNACPFSSALVYQTILNYFTTEQSRLQIWTEMYDFIRMTESNSTNFPYTVGDFSQQTTFPSPAFILFNLH